MSQRLLLPTLDQEAEKAWARALLRFREDKDAYFRTSGESPLPPTARAAFTGLRYFDPDPASRHERTLQRYQEPDTVVLGTSKETRQLFKRVGYFDLNIEDGLVRVHAYQSAERDYSSLFIPFRDATSGKESYGAARYLDLEVEHDDAYALDFNYAYNPYCAYSEDYVCPLPPAENWLKVPIRAGERKYHD